MSHIIADLRQDGRTISEEGLSFFSPYVTPGVKRFGEYGLDLERELELDSANTLATEKLTLEGWIE